MKTKSQETFGELLTQGLKAIQRAESKTAKKRLTDIQEELGKAINRQSSAIEWYRKGNLPITLGEIETLARQITVRGSMTIEWLEKFLKTAGHPNWTSIRDELFFPEIDTSENADSRSYLFKRRKLYISKEIFSDGSSKTYRETEIESISDTPVNVIRSRITSIANDIDQFALNFENGYRSDAGRIDTQVIISNSKLCIWVVRFVPPLYKGQTALYSYNTTANNSFSMTAREIIEQHVSGQRADNFEACSVKIAAPTDYFELHLLFPESFPITLPATGGFGVKLSTNEYLEEKTRLISTGSFVAKFDATANRWKLELKVHHPKTGCAYALHWLPKVY